MLLDNMSPDEVREAVEIVEGCCDQDRILGPGRLDTIAEFAAETGVDFISIGALTHSARLRHRSRHPLRILLLMLLAIDAGNTHTVVGLFDGHELVDHWRIATDAERTSDELALMVAAVPRVPRLLVRLRTRAPALDACCSGRAESLRRAARHGRARQMTERYFGFPALVLEPGVRTGMPILYDNPKEVGADRIANAIGAYDLYGGPTIVVDFGTATTVEVISAKGEYLGGAIVPGIEISIDALFGRAAGLRRVELAAAEACDRQIDR